MAIILQKILERELYRRKLSINFLASECNIPISVLHGWVKDGAAPSGKNLVHVKTLSNYFGISVDELLFQEEDEPPHLILFSSTFRDGGTQYKLTIEKMRDDS